MDLLQEAFNDAPEPCKARFIMDVRTLFILLYRNSTDCNDNTWKSQDKCFI